MKFTTIIIGIIMPIWMFSQNPSFSLGTNSKYYDFKKTYISDDFKNVSQVRVGTYLTLGNFGYTNSSWIGSNALLDYSTYGSGIGSLGAKNFFKPVWTQGTALIMELNFVDGKFIGFNHEWDGQSSNVNFEDFEKIWEFGKTNSYFLSSLAIGVVDPGSYKLAVNGNIRAKEIKVETGWSDFVFEEDYNLPTLKEVEQHIKEKGHLKDIPSADEVSENGILLGNINAKLLQKIEELTLYTIDQEKKITSQDRQLKKQTDINSELKARLLKLEELLLNNQDSNSNSNN